MALRSDEPYGRPGGIPGNPPPMEPLRPKLNLPASPKAPGRMQQPSPPRDEIGRFAEKGGLYQKIEQYNQRRKRRSFGSASTKLKKKKSPRFRLWGL